MLERSVRLTTRRGLGVLGVYLLAQALVQTMVGVVVGTRLALATHGTADAAALATAIQALGGPGACVAGAVAGLAVLRTLPRAGADAVASQSDDAVVGRSSTALGFFAGVALAACYILAATNLYPPSAELEAGPFATMAGVPGVHRFLWAAFAIACAPAVEEVVFRGAVFTTLERLWGTLWSGIVVTAAFVALHASELGGYPPAMASVTALALLALALRVRTGGVVAAIAAHTGYNLVIVANSFLA